MDLILARRQLTEMGSQQRRWAGARLLVERRKSAEPSSGLSQPSGQSDISVGLGARGVLEETRSGVMRSAFALRCVTRGRPQ